MPKEPAAVYRARARAWAMARARDRAKARARDRARASARGMARISLESVLGLVRVSCIIKMLFKQNSAAMCGVLVVVA